MKMNCTSSVYEHMTILPFMFFDAINKNGAT